MTKPLSHHAYFLAGSSAERLPEIAARLDEAGFATRGNPDYWFAEYELFGIDEARSLKEAAGRQSVTGGQKVFVVAAKGITREAQNALLKAFEEPVPGTHFFLLLPSEELLLPTLRSRLSVLRAPQRKFKTTSEAKKFISAPARVRIEMVQALVKSLEEGSREEAVAFLDMLEVAYALYKEEQGEALAQILSCKKYARDRAPSFKLILEHLALVLPRLQ